MVCVRSGSKEDQLRGRPRPSSSRPRVLVLEAILIRALALLAAVSLGIPSIAQAEEALTDDEWQSIIGRDVQLVLADGKSAEGRLSGFDDSHVNLVSADGSEQTLIRSRIVDVRPGVLSP